MGKQGEESIGRERSKGEEKAKKEAENQAKQKERDIELQNKYSDAHYLS